MNPTPYRGQGHCHNTVGGYLPVKQGVNFNTPCLYREGVMMMVTYSELFLFGTFVISLISLIIQIIKKK